ncbi:gag_pre-integrs domain-containing protein, partial [Cephalotus follicularis]
RTIGSGKMDGGLYILDSVTPVAAQISRPVNSSAAESELLYWHLRLGHPPLRILSSLFPRLFNTCNPNNFICESCIFAKQTRVSFPVYDNKSDIPFSVIHSDVWG